MFYRMGIFLAHKRKFVFAAGAVLLLTIYLLSIWFHLKTMWYHHDNEDKTCDKFFVKTLNDSMLSEDVKEYTKIMKKRRKHLQKQCVSSDASVKNQPNLFISKQLKFIHCGFYNTEAEMLLPSYAFGNPFSQPFDNGKSLKDDCDLRDFSTALYVKQPLEILLRLYHDKTLLSYYFTPLKPSQTVDTFHKNTSALFPTFRSFLEMISNTTVPSFSMGLNSDQCQLCKIDYDVIILPESRYKDVKYMFQILNLPLDENALKTFRAKSDKISHEAKKLLKDPALKYLLKKIKLNYFQRENNFS